MMRKRNMHCLGNVWNTMASQSSCANSIFTRRIRHGFESSMNCMYLVLFPFLSSDFVGFFQQIIKSSLKFSALPRHFTILLLYLFFLLLLFICRRVNVCMHLFRAVSTTVSFVWHVYLTAFLAVRPTQAMNYPAILRI